jgi:nucleotide-binding universal stress UspA family protein
LSSGKPGAQKAFASANPERILVAFDGSESARKAFDAALQIAKNGGSKLMVIAVVGMPVYFMQGETGLPPVDYSQYLESAKKAAESQIAGLLAEAKSNGATATGEVVMSVDSTAQAIIDYASNHNADLIVVGSRGLGGLKKMLLGSVSSAVVSHAPCQVLVVR